MEGTKSILHNYLHEFALQNAHTLQTSNWSNFTFMLPCILIDLFLNNQKDALIIQIDYVIKLYINVSQTVVRGPQVVLGFCPCGPLRLNISQKKTEKIKLT
jgi:hypothetical protein